MKTQLNFPKLKLIVFFASCLFLLANSDSKATQRYVNDNSLTNDGFTSAVGSNANPGTPVSPYATIAFAITASVAGDTIYVDAGTYNEDLTVNKSVKIFGIGNIFSIIRGLPAGSANTIMIGAANVVLRDLTVTRDYGANLAAWQSSVKSQGINLNASGVNAKLENLIVKDNRNGIYINNAQNVSVTGCTVENNRTGIQYANTISGAVLTNNFIRKNFTMGVLFNFDLGVFNAVNAYMVNNDISGNWYAQISFQRGTGAPSNVGNLSGLNMGCNWLGSVGPTATAAATGEPGYATQVPSQFGGTDPGLNRSLYGQEAALIPYSSWLINPADIDAGTEGFQPAPGSCVGTTCGGTLDFNSAVILSSTQAAGQWYKDRYAPSGFFAPESFNGGSRLKQSISAADCETCRSGFNTAFYNTQGRKFDLPSGITGTSIELYIPSAWATTGKRMAGFWGTGFTSGDVVSAFPIIEFTSDAANPRFRGYESGTGLYIDMGLPSGFAYDTWVTLKMEVLPSGEFRYSVNDLSVETTSNAALGTVDIANTILQGHNTLAGVTYDIYWDNLSYYSMYANATASGPLNCATSTVNVVVSPVGGTSPYSGTGTFTAGAGTHGYTVTDANGCTYNTSVTIAPAPAHTGSKWYVNDNSQTGDVFTGITGNVSNSGTAACPFLTISQAISAAASGDTIYVDAGTYNENVVMNKSLTMIGSGVATTIISASTACSGDGINISASNVNVSDLRITGFNYGIRTSASTISLYNVESISNCQYGLTTGNGTTALTMIRCKLNTNNVGGWRAGTGDNVSYVMMDSCEVKNNGTTLNGFGMFIAAGTPAANTFDYITIKNSDFSNNLEKGMYFEKLRHALIDNVIINNSGTDVNYGFNNGIDINLKYDSYSDITIQNSTITNCGSMGTAVDANNPAALAIKARDDSPAYNTDPASLTGYVMTNNFISGPVNGLRFGEYNKVNTTPTGITLTDNDFGGAYSNFAVLNTTSNSSIAISCNWYGTTSMSAVAALHSNISSFTPYLLGGGDLSANAGFQPAAACALPCAVTASATSTDAGCPSFNDGTATVTPGGGVLPYSYLWSDGQTTAIASMLIPGTYSVTVSDVNGCTATSSAVVTASLAGPVHNINTGLNYCTIQAAVSAGATVNGHMITVDAGTYNEDVTVNKQLTITGAGIGASIVSGPIGGGSATFQIGSPNVIIEGFTITRAGNNLTDWNNAGLNSAGIAVQGLTAAAEVRLCEITGMRTGIDVNNSNGNNIHDNNIHFNRTGMIFRNQTDNTVVVNNFIKDNWTVGVLFLDASSGTNVPVQRAANSNFSNNDISGNWYGQIVDRQTGGALPAAGSNLKSFTCNWYGVATPVVNTSNSAEPGYAAQIPVAYGGSAVAPGGQPDILGNASANFVYTPYLTGGVDLGGNPDDGFQPASSCSAPCALIVSTSTTATTCPSNNNGTASVTVTGGGISPYTYLWSNGGTSSTITGLVAGTYSVTVTDVNGCTATASAVVTSSLAGPVHNINTGLNYCTIQAAINAVSTVNGNTITIDPGTYNEKVLVNKSLTIQAASTQPTIDFTGTVTGKPALFDISANNVTIDNIHFNVDLSKLKSAIIASGAAIDNIIIQNNIIDAYGTPAAGTYSDRNAVSINYTGNTNYRVATGGVNSITFTNNTVNGTMPASFFRAGVVADEAGGTFTGNTLQTINHDVLVRFGSNGNITVTGNNFNGGGVELDDMNAGAGILTVSNNIFDAAFANSSAPGTAVLRLQNNYNSKVTTVSGNTFSNHDWAVSLSNYNSVTIDNNTFTPLAASASYHHIAVNSKSISGNSSTVVQVTMGATITNNVFNGSGTFGGTALSFHNHDSNNASYGTFTIGGSGNENDFNSDIASVIYLDHQTGTSSGAVFPAYTSLIGSGAGALTTMALWSQNLDATLNNFDLGSGLQLPSAMTLPSLFTLEDRIQHAIDAGGLGFVRVKANNDYVTVNSFASPLTTSAKIQRGVDAASNGHTVNIGAGNFSDNVVINKQVILAGQGQGVSNVYPAISNPDCGGAGGGSICAGGSNVLLVQANNVIIHDLTVDGDNTSLTSGILAGGADLDARNGIITDHTTGVYQNLEVYNVTVQNIYLRGMYASTGGTFNFHDNTVNNVQANSASIGMFNFGGSGSMNNNTVSNCNDAIASNWSTGTVYSGNIVSNSGSGIHTDNNGGSGGIADIITGNTVQNSNLNGYGIWVFAPYRAVQVTNNTVNNVDVGMAAAGQSAAVTTTFSGNIIDGQNKVNSTGMYVTTNVFGFGSSDVSVDFNNNYVVNNAGDGFYLESQASHTLSLNAHNNSITGNAPFNAEKGVGASGAGSFNVDMTCNWWGSTTPATVASGISGSITYVPYLSDGTDNSMSIGFQPLAVCSAPCVLVASASSTAIACNGGTATVTVSASGGTGSYSGTGSFVVTAGTYTYTVTDVNGCTASTTITVTEPTALVASSSASPILCNGGTSTVTVSATGGTTPYSGTGTFTVSAGTYNYVVTDANGCSTSTSVTITQPAALVATSVQGTPIACNGGTTTVTVSGSGGSAPYSGEGVFTVAAGTHTYVVSDANGCTTSTTVTVTEPALLVASYSATPILCYGGSAVVTITGSGGTSPYSGTGPVNQFVGTMVYSISDANGCSASVSVTLTQPMKVEGTTTTVSTTCAGNDGSVTVNASGGTGTYTYLWTGGQTTQIATGLSAGTYIVTITDGNGCTGSASATVASGGSTPSTPGGISGPGGACRNQTGVVYSVAAVPGATSYVWTLPAGASGSSTTNSITLSFGPTYAGGFICVAASNVCGTSTQSCMNIPVLTIIPTQPTPISGPSIICGGNIATYSATSVNALSYFWKVTGTGVFIVSGQGTNTVQVNIPVGFGQGSIQVNGVNCVGNSVVRGITLTGIPSHSNAVSGPNYICANNTATYTMPLVNGATTYTWTSTGDITLITSSQNSLNSVAQFNFGPAFTSGTITITVSNSCGSYARSFVVRSAPDQPGGMTGPSTALCGASGVTYSIGPVATATSYTWTTTTPGIAIQSIAPDGLSVVVNFTPAFTNNGSICVTANNGCGASVARCYTVSARPATPVVTGPTSVCKSQTAAAYSIPVIPSATSYTWSVTGGAVITPSGTSAAINYTSATSSSAIVRVNAVNSCGPSQPGTVVVNVNLFCRTAADETQALEVGELSAYPNPSGGKVVVEFYSENRSQVIMTVTDLTGNLILNESVTAVEGINSQEINLENLPKGIYMLNLKTDESISKTIRLVIE